MIIFSPGAAWFAVKGRRTGPYSGPPLWVWMLILAAFLAFVYAACTEVNEFIWESGE
jgi:hypothetical protein